MTSQTYEFKCDMTCSGCSGAIQRVLDKAGEKDVRFDLNTKRVFVTTTSPSDKILTTMQKTGKKCEYVGVVN